MANESHPGRRTALAAVVVSATMLSASCTALRPRDDERVKIATEASTLAQELRQPDADPFAAMARNVETVATGAGANDRLVIFDTTHSAGHSAGDAGTLEGGVLIDGSDILATRVAGFGMTASIDMSQTEDFELSLGSGADELTIESSGVSVIKRSRFWDRARRATHRPAD